MPQLRQAMGRGNMGEAVGDERETMPQLRLAMGRGTRARAKAKKGRLPISEQVSPSGRSGWIAMFGGIKAQFTKAAIFRWLLTPATTTEVLKSEWWRVLPPVVIGDIRSCG